MKQEREVEGYYNKRAVIIWSLVVVISLIGIIRWNVL